LISLTIDVSFVKLNSGDFKKIMVKLHDQESLIASLQMQLNSLKEQSKQTQKGTGFQDIAIGAAGEDIRIGSDSTESIRISSEKIFFQDCSIIELTEITSTDARVWSQPTLDILVGTTVTWTWTTYENVVQSNEAYVAMSNPTYTSGELQKGGAYSLLFEETGVFYFMSENSLTLRTKVTVTAFSIVGGNISIPDSLSVAKSLSVAGGEILPIKAFCVQVSESENDCCPQESARSASMSPNFYFNFNGYDLSECLVETRAWESDLGCSIKGKNFYRGNGCCPPSNSRSERLTFRICYQ